MNLFAPHVADGYKIPHRQMFPLHTNYTYGNLTARADRLFLKSVSASKFWDHKVAWFGLQGILQELKELWDKSFFSQPKEAVIRRYKRRMDNYMGVGKVPTDGMERLHDLGYLPIQVLGLPEGSRVNMNVPLYVIYNTDPDFFWFTNYLETSMSNLIWKMVTNATIAYEYRRVLEHWAKLTGSPEDFIAVQGHDFAYRGVGGPEDGCRSNSAHLTSFCGTDTITAIDYVEDYYGANVETQFVACTIPATEHAVATANILSNLHRMIHQRRADGLPDLTEAEFKALRLEGEQQFIRRLITEVYPDGGISLVCDSFNFWGVLTDVLPALKPEIMARTKDSTGLNKVVVRPDSGDPVEIICGVEVFSEAQATDMMVNAAYLSHSGEVRPPRPKRIYFRADVDDSMYLATDVISDRPKGGIQEGLGEGHYVGGYLITKHTLTAEEKGAIEVLWDIFGGTVNDNDYRVLDEHIGLIYGDSITVQRTEEIMRRLARKNFASCNVVLGIGSYTYQYNTRDTFGMAIKATAVDVGGTLIDLYKAPATEGETAKKSAKGFLRVVKDEAGDFILAQEQEMTFADLENGSGELRPVFKNGEFLNRVDLETVRARLRAA
ncbi:putative nicotinate phosphoribosyltransferase [compost metagenome]